MEFHPFLDWEFEDWLATRESQILLGAECQDSSWLWLFEASALFFIFVAATQIVIVSEPELPSSCARSPEMMQDHEEFEPSVTRLFLVVSVRVIQRASSLDLGPLFAEAAFESALPSDFVLGADKHSEDGFRMGPGSSWLVWKR